MRTGFRSAVLGATLAGLLGCVACGEPDFVVHVTFPGSVGIEEDAPVHYQGLVIGKREAIPLHQESPERPSPAAESSWSPVAFLID